jgi:hypothetical protein
MPYVCNWVNDFEMRLLNADEADSSIVSSVDDDKDSVMTPDTVETATTMKRESSLYSDIEPSICNGHHRRRHRHHWNQ